MIILQNNSKCVDENNNISVWQPIIIIILRIFRSQISGKKMSKQKKKKQNFLFCSLCEKVCFFFASSHFFAYFFLRLTKNKK